MNYTLEKAKNEMSQLCEAVAALERVYNHCYWNDAVHASYRTYVMSCKSAAFEIEMATDELEKSCSRLYEIEPEPLIREAAATCKKIAFF